MVMALIVEDEKHSREVLRDFIPWRELGVDSVRVAGNGIEALAGLGGFPPDIMICDIRMPRMNGIELALAVRDRYPDCGIIFLSGYSDKEYLRAAIRVHAADYIEKPIDIAQVSASVKAAVGAVLERAESRHETDTALQRLSETAPLLRQDFAAELLLPGADIGRLTGRYGETLIRAFLSDTVAAAIIELDWRATENDDYQRPAITHSFLRFLNGDENYAIGFVAAPFGPNRVALFADGRHAGGAIETELRDLASRIDIVWGEAFGIAIGLATAPGSATADGRIAALLKAAERALDGRFFHPSEQVFAVFPDSPGIEGLPPSLRETIRLHAAARSAKSIEGELGDFATAILDSGSRDIAGARRAFEEAGRTIFEAFPCNNPADSESEWGSYERAVQNAASLSDLVDIVGKMAEDRLDVDAGHGELQRRIDAIRLFIRERFADPDLSVGMIASQVGLSEAYLCTIFKQVCGTTVNGFITEFRIEKARETLRASVEKLQTIALQVGFRDVNYFSFIFKKRTGITPSEYRERFRR
jgi:two-component system, response regulator YesN